MPFVQISLAALILSPTSPALSGQAAAAPQEKSLYKQIVKNPTGKNGYEDYLMAADLLKEGRFSKYREWEIFLQAEARRLPVHVGKTDELQPLPEALPGITRQSSVLDLRREIARSFAKVLEIVREGNSKPVFDPREKVELDTPFPEFVQIKNIAGALDAIAYVRFADGNSIGGTDALLVALEFSQKFGGEPLIRDLVAISCTAITLASFENHLGALSQRDAARIATTAKGFLEKPPTMARAFRREAGYFQQEVARIIDSPGLGRLEILGWEEDAMQAATKVFGGPNFSQRADLKSRAVAELGRRYGMLISRLEGPESGWIVAGDPEHYQVDGPPTVRNVDDLQEFLIDTVMPLGSSAIQIAAKSRTQLRLLRLHGLVLGYKWKNGFFPTALADAVPKDELTDPFSNQEFQYQVLPGNVVRIYSAGFANTGEIELRYRYRFPKRDDIDPTNPPPK